MIETCWSDFLSVLMCDILINVLLQTSALVGPLRIVVFTVFTCIVCTVFIVLFRLCIFILICFVCTSVRTAATE
jgi:hypothetical protein